MGREAIIDVSLRFNYEKTHGSLNNLKKGLREIGESVDVDSPIREQVNRIEGAVDELQNKLDSLKLGKISSTAFNNAVNDINSSVDELSKRMLALESLFQGSGDGASNLLNNAKSELKSVVNIANEAMDAVKKIREASGSNSINIIDTKELENRKKKLKQLSDAIETAEEGGFSIKDKTKFNSRTDKENLDLYINRIEELTKLQQKLSSTKVDDPGFADLAKDVATYSASVSKLYNAITEKMTETGSDTFAGMKLSGIDDLYNNAAKAMSSARDVIDKGVRDINDSMAALGNKSNEPETITLDFKTSTTELKAKLIKMISALQQVAASHPVEVELNFTSGWATKKNKKLLKEFETKINSLTDKTTKEEMQKLVDDISASFGNRLDFEIKSEKLDDVEKKVKDLVDNLKDILKEDFSVEISKASFSDDVKSTLQDSLNDIAKNLKIVIDNVELGENVNVADLQQAVSNINNTISNPRLSDILRQIYEANKDMDDSKFTHTDNINGQEVERYFTSLERKLYVNSKTGWIGNPFYAGIREGTPRFNKQIAEAKAAGADVGIHTHPSSLSAMSYFSTGDFKSFYDQFIFDKMKKQVVSSRIDAEIFDVEGFFSKYADLIDFANQSVWDELTKEESKFQEQYRKIPNRDRFYSFFKDQMTDEDYDTFISNILEKYALQKDLDVLKKNGSIKSQLEKIYANDKNTNITTAINQLLRGSLSDKHIQRLTSRKDIDFNGAITGSITKIMASHGYDLQDAFQYHYGQYMKTAVENAWGKYSKDGKSTKGIGEDLINNFIKIVPSEKLDEALGISGISQAASEATSSTKTLGDALQEIVNILNEIKAGSNFADIFKGVFEESSELKSFLDSLKKVFNTIEEINGALTNASPTDTLGDMSGISTTIENINSELTTLVGILKSFPDISNQIKLDDTFKAMADYTEQLDDINLKDGNMKSVYKDLISNYWDYVKSGGTKDITELTSNKKAQKKLKNGYESYLKLHPLPNIEDDAAKMKSSIETIVKAVTELRTSVGENFGSIFSGDLGFKDAVTGIQDVSNALFSLLEIIEKFTGISSSATLDKLFFNLGFETETMGNIDARSKAFKNIIKQYDEYVKAGGTKKISDLTPDEAVKKKLDTGYSNYIKKQQNAEKASRAAVKARESVMKAEEEEKASFGAVAVPVDEVDEKNDKLQKSFEEVVNGIKNVQTSISALKDSLNFSEGVTGINTLVSSMENLIALLEKMSGFKSKATLDNIFSNLSETTKAQNNLKANSKIFKDILKQYDEYSQLGGTKDITELTDDVKLQENLRAKYAEYVKAKQEAEAVSKQQATTSQTSAESATEEASALQSITSAATAAATAKELFTKANQGVDNSAIKSADSVDAEGDAISSVAKIASQKHGEGVSAQAGNLVEISSLIKEISAILSGFGDGAKGFEALNKIVNNLGGKNGDAKLQATVDGLRQIFEILNTPMSESSMMEAITKIADSGEKLKDLATVLKSTKKDLDNASKTVAGENQPNIFTEDEFEKERKILEEGRKYLSNYGQVLDVVLSRGKNGMTNLVSRVMGEDPNTHEKKIQEVKLTTADGRYFTRDYIKQNTADLAKYMMQMQRAKEFAESRMKFGTEEVFLKDDTDEETWNKLISYASQYAEQIGNILKITRQTRQNASGNLLESFTFVGDKGHVTMGQEFDEVASSQTYTNPQQIASAYDNLTRSVNAYVKAKMESSLKSGDFGDTAAINEIDTLVNKLTIDTQEANQKLGSMQNIAQEAKVRYEDALSGAYDNYINDYLKKAQGQVDRANATRANQRNGYTEEYLEQLKIYKEVSDELKTLRESHQAGQLWNNDELEKTVQLIQTIERILPGLKDNNNILAKTSDIDKELSKLNKDLADNSISGELLNRYMTLVNYLNQVRTAGEGAAEGLSQISKIELGKVKDEVQDLHNQMIQTGQYGKGFWKQFTGAITSSSANFLATYFSLQDIIRYAQDITSTVTAIDSALIELQKVSDASNERIQQNFEKSAQTAQDMGATITDVINSTSDWARQGYTVDESEELARVTQLYQNVGDNISQEEASKSLVSTLQGFQLGADQAESVIDKFNEVANNFSIDTYGIGQALERSAASFYASGTDLSKAVALVTTANTVLQNPESVGI